MMELRPAIAGRLLVEGCRDLSLGELARCFDGCASPDMLMRVSQELFDGDFLRYAQLEALAAECP